jgi:hypothetical protein
MTMKAECAHEAGHVLFTDKKAWENACDRGLLLQHILNVLEDARVERAVANTYPGTLNWLRFKNEYLCRSREDCGEAAVAFLWGLCSYAMAGRVPDALDQETKGLVEKCRPFVDEARLARDTWEVLDRAEKIHTLVKDAFPAPNLPPIAMTGTDSPREAPQGPLDPRRVPVKRRKQRENDSSPEEPQEDKVGCQTDGEDNRQSADDESDGSRDNSEEDSGNEPEVSEPGEETEGDSSGEDDNSIEGDGDGSGGTNAGADTGDKDSDDGSAGDGDPPSKDKSLPDDGEDDSGEEAGDADADSEDSGDAENKDSNDDPSSWNDDEQDADFNSDDSSEGDSSGQDAGSGSQDGEDDSPAGDDQNDQNDDPGDSGEEDESDDFSDLLEEARKEFSAMAVAAERQEKESARSATPEPNWTKVQEEVSQDLHRGCYFEWRDLPPSPKAYQKLIQAQQGTVRRLVEEIRKALEFRATVPRRNLKKGRLDAGSLWKLRVPDPQVFSRREVPGDIPELAVYLLVDCSGSMGDPQYTSRGSSAKPKIDMAREAACALHEACAQLKIAHCVVGFVSDFPYTDLYQAVGWKERDGAAIASLTDHSACNRDGYVIRVVARELGLRPEPRKVLIVLSDGLPNDGMDGRYSIRSTSVPVADTAKAVREIERKGVGVVGVYFGNESDLPRAQTIYNRLVYVQNVGNLPVILGRVLKQVITQGA